MTKRQRHELPVDKSKCKCLADIVSLYIRYACPKLITNYQKMQDYAENIYKELVRGEIVGNPKTTAAGILYVSAVMTRTYGVSQQDIAELLYVSESSVRIAVVRIKQKAQKQGLFT